MTLAGTGKLIRFLLRVSRVRIALWIAGVALLVGSTAISVDRLYPTQADLDAAAAPRYGNTAIIAMLGPTLPSTRWAARSCSSSGPSASPPWA